MPPLFRMKLFLLALSFSLSFAVAASASDYASEISAYRRAHGLSAVRLDSRLGGVALKQARAMASSGTVSHSAAGSFSSRLVGLRKSRAAENIGAGFLSFSEMLKQWQDSSGHRANLLMPGARRVGVASADNPKSPYRKFWAMVITD
jgi:uncharacterized protein YkwD